MATLNISSDNNATLTKSDGTTIELKTGEKINYDSITELFKNL